MKNNLEVGRITEMRMRMKSKFEFPLRCNAKVFQLPRHIRNVHGEAEINTSVFILTQDCRRTFDKFEKWILSPDGGEKDPKPASLV